METKISFSSDPDSVRKLDGILNSYRGRDWYSVWREKDTLQVALPLLERGEIAVTEHTYRFEDRFDRDDPLWKTYGELARNTRWVKGRTTRIQGIRMNALRQMEQEGKPTYDGYYICYREGRVCVHCGNLPLTDLLYYLILRPQLERMCLFVSPWQMEDHMAKWYRFDLSGDVLQAAKYFHWEMADRMQRGMDWLFPPAERNGSSGKEDDDLPF